MAFETKDNVYFPAAQFYIKEYYTPLYGKEIHKQWFFHKATEENILSNL